MVWMFGLILMYLIYCLYLGLNEDDRESSYSPPFFVTLLLLLLVGVLFGFACLDVVAILSNDELKMVKTYRLEQQQKRIVEDLQKLKEGLI